MADTGTVQFAYPHCRRRYRADRRYEGREFPCPNPACGRPVAVPLSLDDDTAPPTGPCAPQAYVAGAVACVLLLGVLVGLLGGSKKR